ncbi:MAG: ATP-binding cassette domain-containing protein [Armatimonadetes bacterium]|nr:ATP-binding cassette domain-containing protein [Armatimonadota bacterium]
MSSKVSSSDIAVAVRGLSKAYFLAHQEKQTTIREAMVQKARNPFGKAARETFWALKDVEFDIARGDVVGIIGRNGAGKSTLLKILSNITRPTRGYVDLFGRVGSLLEVGTGFHLELTGRENIFLNGAILGMRKREIERQFDAIVDFSGVEKFLDTPVKRYSSGMFVRLAFAVAAHLNPDILIIDEVLAVGDAEFQKKCLGKMQDVAQEQGRTVLFVSHNEAAVRRLCKSAIYLKSGQVDFIGTPEQAFAAYRAQRSESGFDPSNRRHSSGKMQLNNAYLSVDGIATNELVSGIKPVLTLEVEVKESFKFYPEVMMRDANALPLLFSPLGLSSGLHYRLPPGEHALSFELNWPVMAAGRYSMDLALAELAYGFYDYLEEALAFVISPSTNPITGWQFEQSRAQGSVLLEMKELSIVPRPGAPSPVR